MIPTDDNFLEAVAVVMSREHGPGKNLDGYRADARQAIRIINDLMAARCRRPPAQPWRTTYGCAHEIVAGQCQVCGMMFDPQAAGA